jgi:Protein of unknown function (DUF1236)
MRRSLLATTAIAALVLAPALGLAQGQSNGPGAIQQPSDQEHGTPKGGKPVKPAPSQTAPGNSAQTQTPAPQQNQQPQRMQGQAQPEPKGRPQGKQQLQGQAPSQPEGPSGQQPRQGQAQPSGQHMQGQAQQPMGTQQRAAGTSAGGRGQVQVTEQQRTQIHERLSHVRVDRIDHPQFSVSIGAVIPRSVHIEVLPPEIVEIVPEYQGFDYVMVGDEILIVDPGSLQIIAVIPA